VKSTFESNMREREISAAQVMQTKLVGCRVQKWRRRVHRCVCSAFASLFPNKGSACCWRKSYAPCTSACYARAQQKAHRDELSATIHFLNRTARWSVSLYYNGWFVWLKNKFWSSKKFSPIYNGVRDAPGAHTHSHIDIVSQYIILVRALLAACSARAQPRPQWCFSICTHWEQVHLWPMDL
jgi:hypothetical protein